MSNNVNVTIVTNVIITAMLSLLVSQVVVAVRLYLVNVSPLASVCEPISDILGVILTNL